jgi:hypothetical protein
MPPSRDEGILFCARRAGAVVSPAREIFPCKKSTVRLKSGNMALHSGRWIVDREKRQPAGRPSDFHLVTKSPCHSVTRSFCHPTPTPLRCIRFHLVAPLHPVTPPTPPPLRGIRGHLGHGWQWIVDSGQWTMNATCLAPSAAWRLISCFWRAQIGLGRARLLPSSNFSRQSSNFFETFRASFGRCFREKPRYLAEKWGGGRAVRRWLFGAITGWIRTWRGDDRHWWFAPISAFA